MNRLVLLIVLYVSIMASPLRAQDVLVDEQGRRWSGAQTLTEPNGYATAPSLAADENGLHIIYQKLRINGDCSVVYMRSGDKGKTWDRVTQLGRSWEMGKGTTLMSKDGILHAAWCPSEKGWNGIVYRHSSDAGVTWSPEVKITSTEIPIYFPQFRTDGDLFYIAWCEKQIIGKDGRPQSPSVRDLDPAVMSSDLALTYLYTDDYDCTLLLRISNDGGSTWSERLVIDEVYENLLTYQFDVSGDRLAFKFRTPKNCYNTSSVDRGLTWTRKVITKEEFGTVLPPIQVQTNGETVRVGTNRVGADSVVYIERTDSTPPETRIVPIGAKISSASVTIQWSGTDDWSTEDRLFYKYRINDGTFTPFQDEHIKTFGPFTDGAHRLEVVSRDVAGNEDPTPAVLNFEIAVPPETEIITAVSGVTNVQSPAFSWKGRDNSTPLERLAYEYRFDQSPWQRTQETTITAPALADGEHVFEVRAVDEAGNVDPTPARAAFTIDTQPPSTLALEVQPHVEGSAVLVATVSGQDNLTAPTALVYAWRIDEGEWSDYSLNVRIPIEKTRDGKHYLAVRSRDEAGNVEAAPRAQELNINIPPDVAIISTPEGAVAPSEFTLVCSVQDNSAPGEPIMLSYQIDDGKWSAYAPGNILTVSIPSLEDGRHRISVRAKDVFGNVDSTPATWAFQVDSGRPGPPGDFRLTRSGNEVVMRWDSPRREDGQSAGWNIYRATEPTFGGSEGRAARRIATGLKERHYAETPPIVDDNITWYYAATFVNASSVESDFSQIQLSVYRKHTEVAEAREAPAASAPSFITPSIANILLVGGLVILFMVVLVSIFMVLRRRET